MSGGVGGGILICGRRCDGTRCVGRRYCVGEKGMCNNSMPLSWHFFMGRELNSAETTKSRLLTGITTILSLGMPEHLVRQVSRHAPNSKEFYCYDKMSQVWLTRH